MTTYGILYDRRLPRLPPDISVQPLTIENSPPITFRVVHSSNAWMSPDKSVYIAPAAASRENHATRSKVGPTSEQQLLIDICKHLWSFDSNQTGQLRDGVFFSRINSDFLSTTPSLPWLLNYSAGFATKDQMHFLCIDLHKAIRQGVKVFDLYKSTSDNPVATEIIVRSSTFPAPTGYNMEPIIARKLKSALKRRPDAMQELFFQAALPRSCIIGEYNWQTLHAALQKSNYWLTSLRRRQPAFRINWNDSLGVRRQLWKKAMAAREPATGVEAGSAGEVYAILGQELHDLMQQHASQPSEGLSVIQHDAARAAEIGTIFKDFVGIELGYYTTVSQHLKLWINESRIELKSHLEATGHGDLTTFYAKAALPAVQTCASIRLHVIDSEQSETVKCTLNCGNRQLLYSGSVNKTLVPKVRTGFPIRDIKVMTIDVEYNISKFGQRKMKHNFVIQFDALTLPSGMNLRRP